MCEYDKYTTYNGDKYEFLFVDLGSKGWRAYILSDINYKRFSADRSDDPHIVHVFNEIDRNLSDLIRNFASGCGIGSINDDTIWYICWSQKITCLEDMREVAKSWSEITSYYVRYGGNFSEIQPILKSRGVISF